MCPRIAIVILLAVVIAYLWLDRTELVRRFRRRWWRDMH